MNYLLDTSALLFWLVGSPRFTAAVRDEIARPEHTVYVSIVSGFEIAVKASIGRLALPDTPAKLIPSFLKDAGLVSLPVSMEHALAVHDLPLHHADPFDRLLIAQARHQALTLVTSDRQFAAYDVALVTLSA